MSEGPLPAFGLIQPENIPGRTIDVGQIQDAAELLDTKAHAIRVQGALVESEWDGLAGVYDAPEAPDLFLLMKGERGVAARSAALATNYSKAASALTTLAYAISSTVQDLRDLHADALEFRATIQNGLVESTGFGETIHESAETTGLIPWADHPPTNERNTELIQAVNAGVAKLDAAQADAVNAINALDATVAGTFAAPYTPVGLDDLNSPGAPSGWGPSRVPESCSYENVRNAGIGWVEDNVVAVSSLVGLDPFSLEFTADAGAAWSGLGMTAAGLVLFATPAGWALQSALGNVKSDGQGLPAPLKAVDDFVNGAGDHIAAAVSGFFQVDTWINDPGKAATTFGLNAASVLMPTGAGGAALKGVASTVKVGALVERLEAVGAKIGGTTGEAFTAGVKATAAGSVEAFNAVKAILDAPDVLAREAAVAARKALAEIAAHIPTFTPSLAGIDNGHMGNESAEEATSGTGGSSVGAGHGGSSSTGYDPHNYNPDGTIKDPEFGEISPERREELLRQRAEHDASVRDGNSDPDASSDAKTREHDASGPGSHPQQGENGSNADTTSDPNGPTRDRPAEPAVASDVRHVPPRVGETDGGTGTWKLKTYQVEQPWMSVQAEKVGVELIHNPDGSVSWPEYIVKVDGRTMEFDGHTFRDPPGVWIFPEIKANYDFLVRDFVRLNAEDFWEIDPFSLSGPAAGGYKAITEIVETARMRMPYINEVGGIQQIVVTSTPELAGLLRELLRDAKLAEVEVIFSPPAGTK